MLDLERAVLGAVLLDKQFGPKWLAFVQQIFVWTPIVGSICAWLR